MVAHESYVSLDVARLLKKAGFDCYVPSCYDLSVDWEVMLNYEAVYPKGFKNDADDILYAPTLTVAQQWILEKYNVLVIVETFVHNLDKGNVSYSFRYVIHKDGDMYSPAGYEYASMDFALNDGIRKFLNRLLEEKK